jgi:regulator of replication initiation timing
VGSWDRPGSSGDKGSDKPPVPKITNLPPPARFERRTPEQGSRESTRGQDGSQGSAERTRPKDKPAEEGNRSREGTAPGNGTSRENATVSQSLFDAQAQILTTHKERADGFRAEVSALRERTGSLEDRLVESSLTIGDLRHENGQLKTDNDHLRGEVDQLRGQLAEKNGHPAEGRPAADTEPGNRQPPAAPEQPGAGDRPRTPAVIGDSGNQAGVPGAAGDAGGLRPVQASTSDENTSPAAPRKGGEENTGGGDSGSGPDGPNDGGDKGDTTDKNAERIAELEQELAEARTASSKLTSTVAKLTETNGKLVDSNASLMDKLDKAESERDEARAEAAAARSETGKRKSKTAETADGSAEGQGEADSSPDAVSADQDLAKRAEDRPTPRSRIPSKEATDILAKAAAAGGMVAVATGAVNGTAEKIVAAVGAIGLAALEYKRQKSKKDEGNG